MHIRKAALAQLAPKHRFRKRTAAAVGSANHEYVDHGKLLTCVGPLRDGGATESAAMRGYRSHRPDDHLGISRASRGTHSTEHERS